MAKIMYLFEPAKDSVYRVEEDCCYTRVVFQGPLKGIYPKLDPDNEENGVLLCQICDPNREFEEIPESLYRVIHQLIHEESLRA